MDAYIIDGIRTPIGRYGGALAKVRTDDLASLPLRALLDRHPDLDPSVIDDVFMGCTNQAGEDNRNVARMAALLAGLPDTVPGATVNRLCASGMDAIGLAARSIRSGDSHVMLAGGVESMTRSPFVMPKSDSAFGRSNAVYDSTIGWRFVNPKMEDAYGIDSMPQTADNVAEDYDISRADQDAYAARSQARWKAAADRGFFDAEITPVEIPQRRADPIVFSADEHPRSGTTSEQLAKLRPLNGPEMTVTAGNASGVNDGAAAVLLASAEAVERHGLTPLARVVTYQTTGVAPRIMGVGPISATQKALKVAGLTIDDIGVIEFNEAFAAQVLASGRALGLADDASHVNANGGAIAMGHPLGMTGARIALTAARRMAEEGAQYGLASMCVGVGQGAAIILERVAA